ncbi:leucine rich repeat containing 36, partial [Homo sapiens]
MAEQWELDEEGIRRLGALTLEQPDSNKGLFIPFPNREIKDSLSTSATQGNGTRDQKLDTFPLGT